MASRSAAVYLLLVFTLAACGTPPVRPDRLAAPGKQGLGRVAFVVDQRDPAYDFDVKAGGAGQGAAAGAAASLRCHILVIICLPIGLVAGAAVGAGEEASAKIPATVQGDLQAEIRRLHVPQTLGESLQAYLRRTGVKATVLPDNVPLAALDTKPDYAALAGAADIVIEMRDLRLKSYTVGEKHELLVVAIGARVRMIRVSDGAVLDEFETRAQPQGNTPANWLEGGAAGLSRSVKGSLEEMAETVVDELLFLYHPARMDPAREKVAGPEAVKVRADDPSRNQAELVPGYALRTIHPPFRNRFYTGLRDNRMNMGHLELYRVDSLQPTFSWEIFPRNFDITPGPQADEAKNLRYDFRLYSKEGVAYEKVGLTVASHTVETPLQPCWRYRWTVRATFVLNGSPRTTEWTGAYSTIGGAVGPWEWRRQKRTSMMWLLPNTTKYPFVTTPDSNGGACPGDD